LFRKYISKLPLLCTFLFTEAQQPGEFDIRRGMYPFFLGTTRAQQDSSFRLTEAGKLEYNGRTEINYQYQGAINHPYLLGGVQFKTVVLTYVSDTLKSIMLSSLYLPRFYPDYSKRAKQEFRQLCTFLKEQWKSPGQKKRFLQSPDNRIISDGWQWNAEGKTMKVALYEDKSKTHRAYDISVTLELSGLNE
jgi:hypothetical protein